MSQKYLDYLKDHVNNVEKAIHWMIEHHIINFPYDTEVREKLLVHGHDRSKFSKEEFDAYDDYFYGKEGRDEDDIQVIDDTFDYAWLHHIHRNPHHWQYWVLMEDDPNGRQGRALMMPPADMYEMIADWWSFSWKSGNLYEIFDWYEKHKEKMILHPKTREIVENILGQIRFYLDQEKKEETDHVETDS